MACSWTTKRGIVFVTWIDLNGPCHGTWSDVAEIPDQADRKRHELALRYGGPKTDPEAIPDVAQRTPPRARHAPFPNSGP